jgi:hypothetical protein
MWIKIKDQLPAEGQQIIAYCPDNGTDNPVSIGFWLSYENGLCDAPDGVVARKQAFTHWQPIPDAPQEKEGHITSGCNLTPPRQLSACPHHQEGQRCPLVHTGLCGKYVCKVDMENYQPI